VRIIDVHGHYTTEPKQLTDFRKAQLAGERPELAAISDDEIRETIESNQLRIMRERGLDYVVFSPRASAMGHDVPDVDTGIAWAHASNDLIFRVTQLFPEQFAGVCQLPQTPNGPLEPVIEELRRCVEELGFVGCNVNPDPSGGYWSSPPLTDEYWFPLYEAMVELDVPAMVHVSSSCNPAAHTLGAHYLNADTSAFMQLLMGDLFERFPTLRFVIPHGGGAVPYHWGRYHGLATRLERPPLERLLRNVFFDTCVYHQAGIDLLGRVIPADNVLFASEMLGAVRGTNPETGSGWDDTKRYVDALDVPEEDKQKIFETNALRVYPRLAQRLS
jgi:4-oxalmesaconate hydratase